MNRYYICDTTSRSGIARYAEDFYRLVLSTLSYEHLLPRELNLSKSEAFPDDSVFHLELGTSQYLERNALMRLLKHGAKEINITLHDPPFITFPSFPFENKWLARFSRGIDWYFGAFGLNYHVLSKCKHIFVLSKQGKELLENRYRLRNIHYIPHIISPGGALDTEQSSLPHDVLFYGFIGPRKGLDYALQMHSEILKRMPNIRLHIVGDATTPSIATYLNKLKARFQRGVTYHGYVREQDLDKIFSAIGHVILPFQPCKYACPVSGSVLGSLKRHKIVWTTPVDAIPEIIHDRKNGFYLSLNLQTDVNRFLSILEDGALTEEIRSGVTESLKGFAAESIIETIRRVQ